MKHDYLGLAREDLDFNFYISSIIDIFEKNRLGCPLLALSDSNAAFTGLDDSERSGLL